MSDFHNIHVTVTYGARGYYAVLVGQDDDNNYEVISVDEDSYGTQLEAIGPARDWAVADDVPFDDPRAPVNTASALLVRNKYDPYEKMRADVRVAIRNNAPSISSPQLVAITAAVMELIPVHRVGDGTPDAALAIGEHAFRAGWVAALEDGPPGDAYTADEAWSVYEPSEDVKALV